MVSNRPMDDRELRNAVLGSFEDGVRWLIQHRADSGGWGDDRITPMPGVTGHLLLSFSKLGMTNSRVFIDDFRWLWAQQYPPNERFGIYWAERGMFTLDELEHTLATSLLAALPMLLFENGLSVVGPNIGDLRASALKWASEIIAKPDRHIRTHGMWQHFMVAWLLDALSYDGELWSELHGVIEGRRQPGSMIWVPREGEGMKDTAQALLALLHFPNPEPEHIQKIVESLFEHVREEESLAYWPCQTGDPYRGPMFATRWVMLAIAEATDLVEVSAKRSATLSKAAAWLARIQRLDGGWVEVQGNPFAVDEGRHERTTGPGFVTHAVAALGQWLIKTGTPIQELRNLIENNFSSTGLAWQGKCFVLMPLKDEFLDVYEKVLKPTLESPKIRLRCARADKFVHPTNIMSDIIKEICEADVVVADLSGCNANVFYELGVSHALADKTVMISCEEAIPFDLKQYRIIHYKHTIGGAEQLVEKLTEAVLAVLESQDEPSNPVQDFLARGKRLVKPGLALKQVFKR